jgi:hypothetical protein
MTNCWNEALVKAPVAERVRLINFLIRLHALFSGWRGTHGDERMPFLTISSLVLSWDVIVEILSEEDHIPGNENTKGVDVHTVSPFLQCILELYVQFCSRN